MSNHVELLPEGTVTAPQGFVAGATFAGMKTYTKDKLDLSILLSEGPSTAAGIFTTNQVQSPSVTLTRRLVRGGRVRGVVANSGIANACVGDQGMVDGRETAALAAKHAGVSRREMAICSTGLIGVELPMALIRAAIPKITLGPEGGMPFARAIMTTDTRPKSVAVRCEVGGRTVTIGGCAKGSGMIHPNMATVLVFLTTDAAVEAAYLRQLLLQTVEDTFNMVTIDGDGSTNDAVLLFANGAAGNSSLTGDSPDAEGFRQALAAICEHLSQEMVRDAEGGSKTFTVRVEAARSRKDARLAAKAIASSSLVKAAVHGGDPNWGRVIAAAGRSGARVEESRIAFYINDVAIMEGGRPIPFHKDAVVAIMSNPEIAFTLRLNLGEGVATAWGCDLTEEYVTFNSSYTT